jgi:ammonia channel protein AmtB
MLHTLPACVLLMTAILCAQPSMQCSYAMQVSVAVTLAAAAGCLGVFSLQLVGSGLNLRCALDGALAGLVAISASE